MNTQTIAKPVHVDAEYPMEIQANGDGGTGYELSYTGDGDGGTGHGDWIGDRWDSDVNSEWFGNGWGGGQEHHNQYDAS